MTHCAKMLDPTHACSVLRMWLTYGHFVLKDHLGWPVPFVDVIGQLNQDSGPASEQLTVDPCIR